jgi:cytochrome c-type biogenesis protein CcmF
VTAGTIGPAAIWVSIGLGLVSAITGRRRWLALAAGASWIAVIVLVVALLTTDFSLDYVARTTSMATPWPYRLAALWGGMDGSMLFYAAAGLAASAIGLRSLVGVRVGSLIGVGLMGITIFFANPFMTTDIPAVDGAGLLAILQHPAMIYHPPLLYLGLVALVVPFGHTVDLTVGSLSRAEWRSSTRRWLYLSWTVLTVGMAAGANWAYAELGWGGFWAWDPVENTSLMPWLAATVWLHSSRLEETAGRARRWNVLFAGLPFALSVMGVYLTRSGVTGSIHSFAEDPVVGRILLAAAAVVGLLTAILAAGSDRGEPWHEPRLDRDGWLGVNSLLIASALLFVTAGSAYPAFASVFGGETLVVDSAFFTRTVLPLAVLVALSLAMSVGGARWRVYTAVLLATTAGTWLVVGPRWGLLLAAASFASLLVLVVSVTKARPRGRRLSIYLAHIGMAVVLIGAAGSSFGAEFEGSMRPGDSVEVGGHTVALQDVTSGDGGRYVFVRALFDVDGRRVAPEIRAYEDQSTPVAEPALQSSIVDDIIVAVSLLFPDGETVAVSVFVRPLVWWVWVGAGLIALAGLTALFSRRGAAAMPHRSATTAPLPGGTTTDTASR